MESDPRGARFLLGLMAVLAVLAFFVVRPFVSYLAMGLVLAYLLRRPYARMARAWKRPRLAAAVLILALLLAVLAPFAALAAYFAADVTAFVTAFSPAALHADLVATLGRFGIPAERAADVIAAGIGAVREMFLTGGEGALSGGFTAVIGFFVFLFVLYYGLVQGAEMVAFVRRSVPLPKHRLDRFLRESGRAIDAVFKGEIGVALIQGVLATVAWWLFGYPLPLVWGLVATLVGILPWTGPALVMVPMGIWDALNGNVVRGVSFIVVALVVVSGVDNVLRPWLIGRTGEIHPALVLIGIVGGLVTFGVAGLFLGPLVLVLLRAVLLAWADEPEVAGGPRPGATL